MLAAWVDSFPKCSPNGEISVTQGQMSSFLLLSLWSLFVPVSILTHYCATWTIQATAWGHKNWSLTIAVTKTIISHDILYIHEQNVKPRRKSAVSYDVWFTSTIFGGSCRELITDDLFLVRDFRPHWGHLKWSKLMNDFCILPLRSQKDIV